MIARTGDGVPLANPAKARNFAAEPRWGRRKAPGLLPAPDAALGLLGASLGMPPIASSPLSPPRPASTGAQDTVTEVSAASCQGPAWPGPDRSGGGSGQRVPSSARLASGVKDAENAFESALARQPPFSPG